MEGEEGKYMYGDFDWSRRENENRADLYTRSSLIAISDNAKKSRGAIMMMKRRKF